MKGSHCKGTGEVDKPELSTIKSILVQLNEVAGTHYQSKTAATQKVIAARLNDGFTAEDFATVIQTKCEQWLRDPTMRKYIRPITLFGPKFEGYLNEAVKAPKQKVQFVY
jgi:uncharacterized phage protein (TIGR02220 family)